MKDKDGTAKIRLYNANIDLGYACFQEKYYRVARAAVNESVCEDSHAEFAMVIYKTKMGIVATHTMFTNGWCLLNILLLCCP